ncbi:MAG TPA: hypothetical protein VHQ90_00135 [Thermoanaerobaculia bacterium]|nr:hypothetical protein [Thermoanaerobaculia bacterium]
MTVDQTSARARTTTDAAHRLLQQAWSAMERARALISTSAALDNPQRRADAESQLSAAMHLITGVGEQLRSEARS